MPWKLIGFVVLLIFATIFIGFNLDHRCDVSIGFTTFKDVPIFLSLLISFVAGVLVMTPFALIKSISPGKKKKTPAETKTQEPAINKEEKKQTKKNATN